MATILVAEDEPEIRELLELNLVQRGHTVKLCEDGAEAVEYLLESSTPPDAMILDIMMPDTDGLEVLEFVRGRDETRTIPVILLTALSKEADRVRGFELGASDYVVKPFSPKELSLRLEKLLADKQREAQLIRRSFIDPITGLWNARYFYTRLPELVARCQGELSLIWIRVEGFEAALSRAGHKRVFVAVGLAARRLKELIEPGEEAFGMGGPDFAVVTTKIGKEALEYSSRIESELREAIAPETLGIALTVDARAFVPRIDETVEEFVTRASSFGAVDKRLEENRLKAQRKSIAQIIAERHKARRQQQAATSLPRTSASRTTQGRIKHW
jgi:two-component system alkaline phosphatase synthesis response regulator PhoP